jgi:hypothetical protein
MMGIITFWGIPHFYNQIKNTINGHLNSKRILYTLSASANTIHSASYHTGHHEEKNT